MRYDTGTVSITGGSHIVTGVGTNFPTVKRGFISFYGAAYQIAQVASATQILLARPVTHVLDGKTVTGQLYGINDDFTPFLDLPVPHDADADKGLMIKKCLTILDTMTRRG